MREPFTATQQSVLGSILRRGPLSLSELAAVERLSAPTISKVVASLEEHDMVERATDPSDRRVCHVAVSERGRQWIDHERERRNSWLADRIESLDAAHVEALVSALPALEALVRRDG